MVVAPFAVHLVQNSSLSPHDAELCQCPIAYASNLLLAGVLNNLFFSCLFICSGMCFQTVVRFTVVCAAILSRCLASPCLGPLAP